MRVLIADKLASFVPEALEALGATVVTDPALADDALVARLRAEAPSVLVVRSTRVTAAHLEAAPDLSLVIRAGAGVNTLDLHGASARGIYVANCPGKNAAAVAELTMGHLINLDRRIADNVIALREHRWEKKSLGKAHGLARRTLAVLGTGQIGQSVIERAKAFGMNVIAWSRSLTEERARALGVEYAASPEDAVRNADAVTVHVALTDETRSLAGGKLFAAMKEGAYFINTSRSEVVDEDALLAAINQRGLRAGLDVFANEPSGGAGTIEGPLTDSPHLYGTHHIGASTTQAEEAVGEEVVRIVRAYAAGHPIPNCVNLEKESPASHTLVVRHADRVGVLASVLDVLREAGHNVQEMQNIVFLGAEAACARIAIMGEPSQATLDRMRTREEVFHVSVAAIA